MEGEDDIPVRTPASDSDSSAGRAPDLTFGEPGCYRGLSFPIPVHLISHYSIQTLFKQKPVQFSTIVSTFV